MPDLRHLLIILLLAVMSGCDSVPQETISVGADSPQVRYTGRWNDDDPAAPWVGWQGSTVSIRFRGGEIVADLDVGEAGEHFRVIIDGVPEEPYRALPPGRQTITLAAGLDTQIEHTAVLMKETYKSSRTTFYGFELRGSEVLDPPPRPEQRIAFFGDSNMEGFSLYSEKDNGEVGTYFAYPATVSRMLGAEMHLQARGGATLAGGRNNNVLSFIYSEEFDNSKLRYRSGFRPQVIVVNAGANDISRLPISTQKDNIKERYRSVIKQLRKVYGDKPHIILYNAYGWAENEPANYSAEISDEFGENVSVLLFPWCWEQWHGDMVDHAGQAVRLANYIESLYLGFAIEREPEVVSGYGKGFDVANGSFEGGARDGYAGFGWRYSEDGVQRIRDAAADGQYFIRLGTAESVHQCIDASGDFSPGGTAGSQLYQVTASIRSASADAEAIIAADFEEQAMYRRANQRRKSFSVTDEWQDYSAVFTAPEGTWKVYFVLRSQQGDIDFDNVRVTPVESP